MQELEDGRMQIPVVGGIGDKIMSENLYSKSTPAINYYGAVISATEPDMRQELINTLEGSLPEIAKGKPGLLRRVRLDTNNQPTVCSCVDSITREPDKDRLCPICFGEGYIFDEEDIKFYMVLEGGDVSNALKNTLKEPGLINSKIVVFYIRYDSEITRKDKLVTLDLELDGSAKTPRKRTGIFRINSLWDYRADNGKLEYWKVFAHEESVRFLNLPNYEDT